MALPFSFSGAFIGLLICHQSINIYSMIGFILLMGIVKKNSILLVDFTNQVRAEGKDVKDALLKACPVRLRPILMTSIAIIAGSLPEALDLGPGAETTIPMAIAIIGGVIASTFLTLFIVPCVYSLFAQLERPEHLEERAKTTPSGARSRSGASLPARPTSHKADRSRPEFRPSPRKFGERHGVADVFGKRAFAREPRELFLGDVDVRSPSSRARVDL